MSRWYEAWFFGNLADEFDTLEEAVAFVRSVVAEQPEMVSTATISEYADGDHATALSRSIHGEELRALVVP